MRIEPYQTDTCRRAVRVLQPAEYACDVAAITADHCNGFACLPRWPDNVRNRAVEQAEIVRLVIRALRFGKLDFGDSKRYICRAVGALCDVVIETPLLVFSIRVIA